MSSKSKKSKKLVLTNLPQDLKGVRFPGSVLPEQKQVRLREPVSLNNKPVWSFKGFDLKGPGQADKLEDLVLARTIKRLGDFETMNWVAIATGGSHAVSIGELSTQAQGRLVELKCDDLDDLYSFRLGGKRRIWGIRRADLVELLWWDPDHKVCPSKLKHT